MVALLFAPFYAFVFAIPWEDAVVLEPVGTISRLLGLLALPLVCAYLLNRNQYYLDPLLFAAVLFTAWCILSILWTIDLPRTWQAIQTTTQMIVLYVLVAQLSDNDSGLRRLMACYVLGAYVAVYTIIDNYLSGVHRYRGRFVMEGFNPNDLSYVICLAIPLAWYLGGKYTSDAGPKYLRLVLLLVYILFPAAASIAVILTASRGGFIALMLALCYALASISIRRLQAALATVVVAVGIVSGIWYLSPEDSLNRLGTIRSEVQSGDLSARTTIWRDGVSVLENSVLVGYGAGTFRYALYQHAGYMHSAHNAFLSLAVENGLIGLMLFVVFLAYCIYRASIMPRAERRLWMTQLAVLTIPLLVGNWAMRKQTWFVLGLLAGHAMLLRRRARLAGIQDGERERYGGGAVAAQNGLPRRGIA